MNELGFGTKMHLTNNTLAVTYMLIAALQQPRNNRLWGDADKEWLDYFAETAFWLITIWFWVVFIVQFKCIIGERQHWGEKKKTDA